MVVVRQKTEQHPNTVGKQLSLFSNVLDCKGYRYTCHMTNIALCAIEAWRLYRRRAIGYGVCGNARSSI